MLTLLVTPAASMNVTVVVPVGVPIVGVGVMQNFTVTFDWKNKWIVLER